MCNRRIPGNAGAALAVIIMHKSSVCAALSAVAAIGCVVAGADLAGTALACGAFNAGLFVLMAVYFGVM